MSSLDELIDEREIFKKAAKMALDASENAITFGSKVGYVVQTYDNKLFAGFNIELYVYESVHAEKSAILSALREGYRFTDFKRLIGVFKEARKDGNIPATRQVSCHACRGFMYDITHPYIEIAKIDTDGNKMYSVRLNELENSDFEAYPSTETRELKRRLNNTPKLPLSAELENFYAKDEKFRRLCTLYGAKVGV